MTGFYKRLAQYCKDHDITFYDLATRLEVNKQTFYMWQTSVPKSETLLEISKKLKLSPFYLLNGDESVEVIYH